MNNDNRTRNQDGIWEVSVEETIKCKDEVELIDVRQEEEYYGELGHIDGARLSTLQTDFPNEVENLDSEKTYIFVCRSGMRSSRAAVMAQEAGIKNVYNMVGGMLAWNEAGLPTVTD